MADIGGLKPVLPVIPRRPSHKVDEETRARDERQRRQQQQKYRYPKPEHTPDDDQPDRSSSIDEYV